MPKLQVFFSDGAEASHELLDEVITIGRLSDNAIQIDDASVSSHHAQLSLVGGDYHIKDLNSTNGTYVNGQHVNDAQLRAGDKMRFGKIETAYVSEIAAGDAARPMPTAEAVEVKPASVSYRPTDFGSFKKKSKTKRDPVGVLIVLFALLSMLAFGGAVASIYLLQAP
jgi:pSer/pThr/pTyr-binding forkhead associated (FHA) protein